ncbi:hypothetical protein B0H19DRAFT_1076988 [Mycena capillaripes]|nr:hypothetical protein B0H19DRAFT_1076988 [Mycena capillaripes]
MAIHGFNAGFWEVTYTIPCLVESCSPNSGSIGVIDGSNAGNGATYVLFDELPRAVPDVHLRGLSEELFDEGINLKVPYQNGAGQWDDDGGGRPSGAARKKPARPQLNRDLGASLEISLGNGSTELGWLGEKADTEMVFEKKTANRGDGSSGFTQCSAQSEHAMGGAPKRGTDFPN